MFILKHRYLPHFKNPRSFNEKLHYIKLYNRNPLRALVVDRLEARAYMERRGTTCKLVNLLWHGKDVDEQVWAALPDRFVIKANHGSKMTKLVDKSRHSYEEIRAISSRWLEKDYAKYGREWMYRDLERYLVVEEMLEQDGKIPPDYKFFVINKRVELVQVDLDRFTGHRRNLYNRNFDPVEGTLIYSQGAALERPPLFDQAVRIAEEASVEFDFMRIDLYLLDDAIYFGEFTNTPENGFGRFSPRSLDFYLGSRLPPVIER